MVLRKNECKSGKENDKSLRIVSCTEDEPVCCDKSLDPHGPFCYFYNTIFKRILLRLPLFNFEKELLTEINVAPASYTQIAGHLFGASLSSAHSLAFCHLLKSFCISLRPNT